MRGIQLKRAIAWAALTHVAARDVERPGSPPSAMA
jgi:hypothetical protein